MSLFEAIDIAGSGLTAERVRMDVTSENLANAQTTRTAQGGPYQRQEVVLQQVGASSFGSALAGAMAQDSQNGESEGASVQVAPEDETSLASGGSGEGGPAGGVQVAGIVQDKSPDQLVYDPSSPEANAKGYVQMPNVDTVTEMTDLITESRAYQADVTAMQTAKSMFNSTLGILK
jgi:flagellar basal-body rod protein FlgC